MIGSSPIKRINNWHEQYADRMDCSLLQKLPDNRGSRRKKYPIQTFSRNYKSISMHCEMNIKMAMQQEGRWPCLDLLNNIKNTDIISPHVLARNHGVSYWDPLMRHGEYTSIFVMPPLACSNVGSHAEKVAGQESSCGLIDCIEHNHTQEVQGSKHLSLRDIPPNIASVCQGSGGLSYPSVRPVAVDGITSLRLFSVGRTPAHQNGNAYMGLRSPVTSIITPIYIVFGC